MKSSRFVLTVVLMSLSAVAFAQSDAHRTAQSDRHGTMHPLPLRSSAPKSEAKIFRGVKSLPGPGSAKRTVDRRCPKDGHKASQVSMRVTSRGNALVHEMYELGRAGRPDAIRSSRHDAVPGRRSAYAGALLRRGESATHGGQDVAGRQDGGIRFCRHSGSMQYGHMHHAVFTVIDANHHTEDWTYMMPGDKPMHAHFDLQRTK